MTILAESLTWAAASMSFDIMAMLRNRMLKLKKHLDDFHTVPSGPAQVSTDHHRNHGERRFAQYKDQLERAVNYTNIALRGFEPAGRIDGEKLVIDQINKGIAITKRAQNALYAIQNTLQASVLNADGTLVGEISGGLCVHACDALTRAAAEIDACVKHAREVSQTNLTQ